VNKTWCNRDVIHRFCQILCYPPRTKSSQLCSTLAVEAIATPTASHPPTHTHTHTHTPPTFSFLLWPSKIPVQVPLGLRIEQLGQVKPPKGSERERWERTREKRRNQNRTPHTHTKLEPEHRRRTETRREEKAAREKQRRARCSFHFACAGGSGGILCSWTGGVRSKGLVAMMVSLCFKTGTDGTLSGRLFCLLLQPLLPLLLVAFAAPWTTPPTLTTVCVCFFSCSFLGFWLWWWWWWWRRRRRGGFDFYLLLSAFKEDRVCRVLDPD